MSEKNPWAKESWNLMGQGVYLQQHGLQKARAAAIEAGCDPDKCGLQEEEPKTPGPPSLLSVFTKEAGEKFAAKIKDRIRADRV